MANRLLIGITVGPRQAWKQSLSRYPPVEDELVLMRVRVVPLTQAFENILNAIEEVPAGLEWLVGDGRV
uniref:Uncharacterized protein n=1 Tax=Trichuris muris TaxID=70415 RepID=A0A5S6Q4V4_TRIMR